MNEDFLNKGKQNNFVNSKVKELDELQTLYGGENLWGEKVEDIDVGRFTNIVQIGNMRKNRTKFSNPQQYRVYSPKGTCPTLTLAYAPLILMKENGEYLVRRMSGVECMRCMGVEDSDIDKLVAGGVTNGQLIQLAGNSICVDVMSAFYEQMIKF